MRDICSMCSIYLWPPKTEPRFYYYCPSCKRDILCDRGLVNTFEYDENNMATGTKPLCLNCRNPVEDRWWPEGSEPEQVDFSQLDLNQEPIQPTDVAVTPPIEESGVPESHEIPVMNDILLPPPPSESNNVEIPGVPNQVNNPDSWDIPPQPSPPPSNLINNSIARPSDLPNIPEVKHEPNNNIQIPDPMNVSKATATTNKTCPNCGALLPFKAKKCPNCHTIVS